MVQYSVLGELVGDSEDRQVGRLTRLFPDLELRMLFFANTINKVRPRDSGTTGVVDCGMTGVVDPTGAVVVANDTWASSPCFSGLGFALPRQHKLSL